MFRWWRNGKKPATAILPKDDPTALGNLLTAAGFLEKDSLAGLVEEFQEKSPIDQLLGQFLVEKGVITLDQLELALFRQLRARKNGSINESVHQAMKITQRRHIAVRAEMSEIRQLTASLINQEPLKDKGI